MTREADLSWQLHRAVVPYLAEDWPANERIIRENLALLKRRPRAKLAEGWVREWEDATARGPEALAAVAMADGERGDDLRQMSPLAGILPDEVRMQMLQQVYADAASLPSALVRATQRSPAEFGRRGVYVSPDDLIRI